ncbi:MAG TPA: PAS domain S-box protein [Thiobacillus sp.]|nr:PAS domain S-box protein [Thiobacillus sp.]
MSLAERLRESKTILTDALRKNELILQFAGEGIFGLDNQGRMTFVNPAAERMLGYTKEDLGQGLAHDLIHPGLCDSRLCPAEECPLLAPCRDGTLHRNHDAVFWQKNGCPLDVQYTSAPIWEAGQITGVVVVFSDNTARKQNEARSARWQHIFEHVEWGVIVCNVGIEQTELMNPAFAHMHGYSPEELASRPITEVISEECHADLLHNIRLTDEIGHHIWESWHVHKDGSRFPVQIDATAVKDETGQVLYRVLNVQDITACRQAEDILRVSEARLRAQTQGIQGSWVVNIPNDTLDFSAENYRIFGLPLGSPLNFQIILKRIHPRDRAYVVEAWRSAMNGEPYGLQHRILVDGELKWVRERIELEYAADGTLLRAVGTTQDITEPHEDELLRSRQNLRELAAHHEKIREEERTRIAREIHDELGQYLTALRMDTAMLNIRFGTGNPELESHAAGMKKTIDTTIGVVRSLAASLRPAALDMGLVSAAEWLLSGFEERTQIRCHLHAPQEYLDMDEDRGTAAFRILQESLTNIVRYAKAGEVNVRIELVNDVLEMDISDDGVGFDKGEARNRKTFGLMGIRERALQFGGESRIDSTPGAGTTLRIRIPRTREVPDDPHSHRR